MSDKINPKSVSAADKMKGGMIDRDPDPETIVWTGSYSGKAMYGTWIVLGIATIAVIFALFLVPYLRTNSNARWIVLGVLALGWILPALQLGYRKLAHFYELTNQRLKHRDGILIRQNNRVEVIDIDDVSFKQGIIETMFNVGTIFVQSSDTSHPKLVLKGISDVKRVSDLIDNARRNERMRRGLYVESI